jgi:hypothetical protein
MTNERQQRQRTTSFIANRPCVQQWVSLATRRLRNTGDLQGVARLLVLILTRRDWPESRRGSRKAIQMRRKIRTRAR